MSFSPNLFLSNIKAKDGLARPNRYEVIVPIPPYINQFVENSILEKLLNFPNTLFANVSDAVTNALSKKVDESSKTSNPSITRYLALQCESAELPGKNIITADAKIYGPTFKVPYQTQYGNGGETSLNFLCTNEFYERKLFERWTEAIMPSDTNNLRFQKDNETRYTTTIKIVQYDDFIKKIFAIELIDAFPISIAPQTLSWADDGFHRLGVQFAFQKYRVVYDGSYNLAEAATALFGTYGARLFDKGGRTISDAVGRQITRLF